MQLYDSSNSAADINNYFKGETNYLFKWQKSGNHQESKVQVETLTRQRKQLSNIRVKDLKGNWTHDKPKVSKKAKLIILQAYQSHKCQKTKHKKLIQHLHIHWKACLVTMNFLQSQGRG